MGRWPRITTGRIMIGIAVLALFMALFRVDPAFIIILVLQGLLFLPLLLLRLGTK
jgi:hypothetical protein